MRKMLISSASLLLFGVFGFSIINHANANVTYTSEDSIGFTGVYTPPLDEKKNNITNGEEKSELPQSKLPNAGDQNNIYYFGIAILLIVNALFFIKKLKNTKTQC